MDHLVLTIIAADKPGLVGRIAQCIAGQGGNWLESRMAHMAGQFAGILRVSVPAESRQALMDALEDLSTHGIRVLVGESSAGLAAANKAILMTLVGNDRPGIVREITALLSSQGVNLERLNTDVRPAPMSGDPLFYAEASLAVPATLTLDTLQAALETLADDLMVELALRNEE
ncbi:glycine cleavage system protein R [Pseudomonas mucidolens]|uniref:Glycine cleavage system transcriptional repressor n=1 Tax=Pseudomonas mucidolens TaxID=46679 RepID=A0A1H2NZT1_9PSED|nr:ACT domain-containing protein [Pseudomonas mucidolens]SDV10924.1 ACT domain protein [Pseudomonas mucidolens]SQH36852.1 ACT domain-containing protein [Pseudomonas mucidolens]